MSSTLNPAAASSPSSPADSGPRFSLGQIVSTPAVLEHLNAYGVTPLSLLSRHIMGDWGELCAEDRAENERALVHGFRLLSRYTVADEPIWIITEADRSVTTLLFPSEY